MRRLAERKTKTMTAAIREAVEHEYEREYASAGIMEAVREAQEAFRKLGEPTGLAADKAFYDELSGEDELNGSS